MSSDGDSNSDVKQGDRLAEAIAADEAPAPPDGLAARVADGILTDADARGGRRARRTWRALPVVGALAAGAALGALAVWLGRPAGDGLASGARAPVAQETIRIGRRAVLVAEAGADLRWRPGPERALLVEQQAGDVFYRVDAGPGGQSDSDSPFLVETPYGAIRVRGTCFRVEVTDMKLINRQNVSAAAVGAALGGALMVTVYEGRVLLAKGRDQVTLGPGDRGEITGDGSPRRVAAGDHERALAPASTALARAGATVPRFDEAQALRARIAEQDKELAELRELAPTAKKLREGKGRFVDASKEELLARVERCEVRFDSPPLNGFGDKQAQNMGMTAAERQAANEALEETKKRAFAQMRELYIEMSGDPATADKLSPGTMHGEIMAKAPPGAQQLARQQLARERAGLAAPPADLGKTSVAERTLRLMMGIGDDLERRLAARIGADRAHALRTREDGWGGKTSQSGCGD